MTTTIEKLDGITLAYQPQDRELAYMLHQTCESVLPMVSERWGVPKPQDLWVYVMSDDWMGDIWRAVPLILRLPFGLTLPFWYLRVQRMWKYIGGWQQYFGRRRVVGVKPPRLLLASDRSIGERIYESEPDLDARVQQLACHELTHACTAQLRLPAWLNEGLAMVAVDQFCAKQSIKPETLMALKRSTGKPGTGSYLRVNVQDQEAVVYLYVRGYWITRYLEETKPGLLKSLFSKRTSHRSLETSIAESLGMDRKTFWTQIDSLVAARDWS